MIKITRSYTFYFSESDIKENYEIYTKEEKEYNETHLETTVPIKTYEEYVKWWFEDMDTESLYLDCDNCDRIENIDFIKE